MIVRSYSPQVHDRFYVGGDKAFVGDPYDFSGVARSSDNWWATLVSDNYFLSATHAHPGGGATVTFYEDNNPAGSTHSYTVGGGVAIAGSDLWLGWFTAVVDPSIARYAVLFDPPIENYLDLPIYTYGVPHRVGQNVVDFFDVDTIDGSTGVTMYFDYDGSDLPDTGGNETFLQSGDSGAPSLTIYEGMLTVLGIHWAISDSFPGTNEGEVSIDTFVPFYIDELNEEMADMGQSLTVVPEPTTTALLAVVGVILGSAALRRRTSRRKMAA